jgi:hypothetical protein
MRALLTLLLATSLIALPGLALGQNIIRPATPSTAPTSAAPALPGLAGRRPAPVIEAEPNQILSPNAALFDAINRGDLAAVRDAVGRGANLQARNALGLAPVDAAVDQGRHEIAFYLLSARETGRPAEPSAASANLAPPRPAPPAVRPAPSRPAAPAAAAMPSIIWSGNGGAPQPAIGFLGFDAGRPANAVPPARPTRG